LIHRDADDGNDDGKGGPLIFGGQRLSVPDAGVGVSRDDEIDPVVAENLRRGLHSAVMLKPSGEQPEELSASHEWSGIMGFSSDDFPWVGQATRRIAGGDSDGLWLCAGFTGHGMPVAARCAMATADMILGREATIELPEEYRVSDERLDVATAIKGVNLRRKLTETTLEFLKAAVAAMPQE
jgi:glycine/D-amino acid oxidase-like deaminating enzyme